MCAIQAFRAGRRKPMRRENSFHSILRASDRGAEWRKTKTPAVRWQPPFAGNSQSAQADFVYSLAPGTYSVGVQPPGQQSPTAPPVSIGGQTDANASASLLFSLLADFAQTVAHKFHL